MFGISPDQPQRRLDSYPLRTAVFGGELQYFRMSAAQVPVRLGLCRQANFTVVQTYVPWNVHEFIPDTFDFTGRTQPVLPNDHHLDPFDATDPVGETQTGGVNGRLGILCNTDLVSFLEQCRSAGLAVILRPGPFISDEWRNGGIPDWLIETAPPQMFEYGPDGTPLTPGAPMSSPPQVAGLAGGQSLFYFPSPSYVSSYYLAAVRRWFAAFAAFVRPWLSTNGGPVVAVQVDDETCFYYHFGPFEVDYNPAAVRQFTNWAGEAPPRSWPIPGNGVRSLLPAFKWQQFKAEQVADYLGTLAGYLRAGGVDVTITHEQELSLSPPANMAADARRVLLTPELYPGADGPEAMPLIELTAQAARAAQRNQVTLYSAETQNGDLLLYRLLVGEGIIGALGFNYTDGVSDSAVNPSRQLGGALRSAGSWLTEARRRADVAIIWDDTLTRAPYGSRRWGFRTDVRAVIERHLPALATALLRAGYSFDLLDVQVAQPEDFGAYPTILLAAADILPRRIQLALVEYVRAGGRLVCWAGAPGLDHDLRPASVLAEECFPEALDAFYPADAQQVEVMGVPMTGWLGVQTYVLSKKASAIATRNGRPCGYRRQLGRGEAILLGTWPAADSLAQRAGEVLYQQPLPQNSGVGATLRAARQTATRYLGADAAAAIPAGLPAGPAEKLIVYAYTNERRGGEYISGGSLCYWNGDQVVGLVAVNTADSGTPIYRPAYRPITAAHLLALSRLIGREPQVCSQDARVQARILDAAVPGVATLVACNRWSTEARVVLNTAVAGRSVRLPHAGRWTLPAGASLLLPIGYQLGRGVVLVQATAELIGWSWSAKTLTLLVWGPSPAEMIFRFERRPQQVTIDDRVAQVQATKLGEWLAVPQGEHAVALHW